MIFEIIGYLGSFLVAISLTMVSIVRLRWINLAGCVFFVVYGVLIGAFPVILTNSFITVINILHLRKLYSSSIKTIHYLELHPSKHSLLGEFLAAYRGDVAAWYPCFHEPNPEEDFDKDGGVLLALKELKAIGFVHYKMLASFQNAAGAREKELLAAAEEQLFPDNTVVMNADYLVPRYRGLGLADVLYSQLGGKLPPEIRYSLVIGEEGNKRNNRFLRNHGYSRILVKDGLALFVKSIERS